MVAERFWSFSGVVTSPLRLILSLLFLYQFSPILFFGCQHWITNANWLLMKTIHNFSLLGISAILGGSMVGLAYLLNWPLIKFDIMVRLPSNSFVGAYRQSDVVFFFWGSGIVC